MIRIIPPVTEVETIAEAPSIRELHRLRQQYGPGRWRKKKGVALVETDDGAHQPAEIHWCCLSHSFTGDFSSYLAANSS
jgi:hypothetical protein